MKKLISFLFFFIQLGFAAHSSEQLTPEEIEILEDPSIVNIYERYLHRMKCNFYDDIRFHLELAGDELNELIEQRENEIEEIVQSELESYKKKILTDQLKTLKKIKKQNAKKEIKEFFEQGCFAEKALHQSARVLGHGAGLIVETAKLPITFSLNLYRGIFNKNRPNEENYLLRSTIGKDLEKSLNIFLLTQSYTMNLNLFPLSGFSLQSVTFSINPAIAPLFLTPMADMIILNICEDKNKHYEEELTFCDNYHKIKKTFTKAARLGFKLGSKIRSNKKESETLEEVDYSEFSEITNDNLCEYILKAKNDPNFKEKSKSSRRDALKSILASHDLSVPERTDFSTPIEQVKQFNIGNLPKLRNVIFSLSPDPKSITTEMQNELSQIEHLNNELHLERKKLEKMLKTKTKEDCKKRLAESGFDYTSYAQDFNTVNSNKLRNSIMEGSQLRGIIKSTEKRWYQINKKTKMDWEVVEANSIFKLKEIIEDPTILNLIIVTHTEGNLGKLVDSELNQIPSYFFKNISSTLMSIAFYTCHGDKILKNYDILNIMQETSSIHAKRVAYTVKEIDYMGKSGVAPLMGFKDFFITVDRQMHRLLKGNLLNQILSNSNLENNSQKKCQIKITGLNLISGTLTLSLNQNLVLATDNLRYQSLSQFDCSLLKNKNTLVLFNLNLDSELVFNEKDIEINIIHPNTGEVKVEMNHFYHSKSGAYMSGKAEIFGF